jgi:[NiFe] hydrogenase diaphorase moiety large subunit
MLVTEREKLKDEIKILIDKYGPGRMALMPILQGIQKKHNCISEYAMQVTADLLGIHPVEVYGVVSFYSFLYDKPHGRFVIRLCRTISCNLAGKDRVARQLESDLGIKFGESTADGKFSLEWANCIGMCDQGPAMLVNNQVFVRVTPEKVHDILEGCRKVFGAHALQTEEAAQ